MKLTPALEALKNIWRGDLYVVGGAVRDDILGYAVTDVDLASPLTPEEVVKLLAGTPFTVKKHSPRLGTLGISGMNEKFEYTAFRSDSYPGTGGHAPSVVRFGVSLYEDALRRDFTVNSVYFDLIRGETVDPLGGVKDIENRVLKTARAPEEVFNEDALRIMRLFRFAGKLGFSVDPALMRAAFEMRSGLDNIAPERIGAELKGILLADAANGIPGAHAKAFALMTDAGVTEKVLPEVARCRGVKQNPKWHLYDVYTHLFKTYEAIAPKLELRLAAILHDIGKPVAGYTKGATRTHPEFGAWLARERLAALCFPQKTIDRVCMLIENHMFDLKGDVSDVDERIFVLEHADMIDDLVAVKNADRLASGLRFDPSPAAQRLRETMETMKKEGVAFTAKELKITGEDTLSLPPEERGYAIKALLRKNAWDPSVRNREGAKRFIDDFPADVPK